MADTPLNRWFKKEVLFQLAYKVPPPDHRIKLNQNESPWDWPPEVKAEVARRLERADWNRYPAPAPEELRWKLAGRMATAPEQFVIGKGSNEVLQAITRVVLRPGDTLCTLSPTFAVYRLLGEQHQARISESCLTADFQVDAGDLLARCRAARLTILCNPNSPTGGLLPAGLIEKAAEGTPGLLVVDEAYVDFSGVSALPLLARRPNLIITRTFSKAFALAGFRLGYAVMDPALAREVQKGLLPFNLDTPSLLAAQVILDHYEVVRERTRWIVQERDKLIHRLNRLKGVTAWPSNANFFLLSTPLGPVRTYQRLAERGILVRDVSGYPGCGSVVRITVGTPEENEVLFRVLEGLL